MDIIDLLTDLQVYAGGRIILYIGRIMKKTAAPDSYVQCNGLFVINMLETAKKAATNAILALIVYYLQCGVKRQF